MIIERVEKMIRQIIRIDEEKCNGCGICETACHEGAIKLQDGKAKLIRDDYCDGLGNCLPVCPTGAISFEQREADVFVPPAVESTVDSQLRQWPIQIQLVPVNAPYFENANLLVAADCAAFAYGDFHNKFIKNRITIIGCPKLDHVDYSDKLTAIIKNNNLKSITVVRMEVPCCGGISNAVMEAIKKSGKMIPWQIVTIGTDGSIIE